MPSGKSNSMYIDTFEDQNLRGFELVDGASIYTRPFPVKGYGNNGVMGLYIDCSGAGEFVVTYETDPGEETGEPKDRIHDWFPGLYRNPLNPNIAVGKSATPVVITVGKYVRFNLALSGGNTTFKSLKLCYE